MIFNEIYSAYYNTVAHIIESLIRGEREEKKLRAIVEVYAFGESMLSILPSLKSGKWQLVHPDMTTPIRRIPRLPLTELQKRWLKAVSMDPRVALFGYSFDWLGDVEPLFTPKDYRIYDQYADGDPFTDEGYIQRFRFILKAVAEHKAIAFETYNRNGGRVRVSGIPERLEYSEKDDKFRVIMAGGRRANVLNLGRVISVRDYSGRDFFAKELLPDKQHELIITVSDYRNALERVMLHFAHFEKQAERIDKNHYRLRIKYDAADETEMVIRVLSFGPMVKVESPDDFVERIRDRLRRQKELFNQGSDTTSV